MAYSRPAAIIALVGAALCLAQIACAAVSYDPERGIVMVVDYPEEHPATLDDVLRADQEGAWGVVEYGEGDRRWRVLADLWIGDDTGRCTFFQIGEPGQPRATVLMKGNIWVRPPCESPPRSDGRNRIINQLTLGHPTDASACATIRFDCETPGQHGLYVGYRSADSGSTVHRGALRIYNSTLTAATPDKEHAWGLRAYTQQRAPMRWTSPGWYASHLDLVNATISWFQGCVAYGVATGTRLRGHEGVLPRPGFRVHGCTFAHGGIALQNGDQYATDTVFEDLQVAVAEGGCLGAKLVRCTFTHNKQNWTLGSLFGRGIEMLDCRVGAQSHPFAMRPNRAAPKDLVRQGAPQYPSCELQRTCVLCVMDVEGKPVSGAFAVATCKQRPSLSAGKATVTGLDGLTPSDERDGALVLPQTVYTATDQPDRPEQARLDWTIAVTARGFTPETVSLPSSLSLDGPLLVTLKGQK